MTLSVAREITRRETVVVVRPASASPVPEVLVLFQNIQLSGFRPSPDRVLAEGILTFWRFSSSDKGSHVIGLRMVEAASGSEHLHISALFIPVGVTIEDALNKGKSFGTTSLKAFAEGTPESAFLVPLIGVYGNPRRTRLEAAQQGLDTQGPKSIQ